jgi:homoserine O-acetyltransferase
MSRLVGAAGALAALLLAPAPAHCHWPGQPQHQFANLGDLVLEDGGVIKNLRMSYVTHGKLTAAKDNAILVMQGWGANHHGLDHLIGPGQALDTDKYFIICTDELGNTQTNFEHSTSPTNSGLKMQFPQYKARDMVKAEYKLVTEGLGIPHLLAVTGGSTGADHSVQMAVSYPNFMDGIIPISGGALWTTQSFNFGPLVTSILESCPGWNSGNYDENPAACAANATLVFVPYFYTREWWEQYVDTPEAYTKWRNTWGAYYFDVQDARDVYYRQMADGAGWVGDTPGFNDDLNVILHSIKAKTLFVSSPHDQFVPPAYVEIQVKAIPNARVAWIDSVAGHFICCNGDPNATRAMTDVIRKFLQELSAGRKSENAILDPKEPR